MSGSVVVSTADGSSSGAVSLQSGASAEGPSGDIKLHSGTAPPVSAGAELPREYREENLDLVRAGSPNMLAHIQNVRAHGVKVVVAVNRFATDSDAEVELVRDLAVKVCSRLTRSPRDPGGISVASRRDLVRREAQTPPSRRHTSPRAVRARSLSPRR